MGLRRSKKEKRERKMFEKPELPKNCAVHMRIFQILKLWTTGQTICRNWHRLVVIKKLSTTWFMDRANSSKAGKIWNVLNNWKHSNFFKDRHVQKIELRLISEKSSYCFVKAAVLSSMRQDRVYRTWISVVKETAKVFSADCNCTAG